ncbi:MAG: hypothetical protein F2675_02305 [Actinobacteria bacterium]|uniref:Unannotated protein n=2 Tax=freshwater metagenome TaxID=449393 RepID=A0A6J6PSC0_9ZZZZ|nr:hypothetical protein [Actinomycetota bacterium]
MACECHEVGYRIFMDSNNPVLSKYSKPANKGGYTFAGDPAPGAQYASGAQYAIGAVIPPADTNEQFANLTAGSGLRLTITDVIMKTLLVFAVVVVFAVVGWNLTYAFPIIMFPALIIATILGFVIAFREKVSPALVLVFSVFEGLMLGAISNWYNQYAESSNYQGIVVQAVVATMTTFGVMLVLYLTGVIKVNKKFVSVLIAAAVTYMVIGLASFVAALFGVGGGWGFYGIDGLGLIICVAGVLIAAFFLMLDFEAIKQGIANGAPERESWRMAFGLLVTLVWIYLEFLRLIAIFTRN